MTTPFNVVYHFAPFFIFLTTLYFMYCHAYARHSITTSILTLYFTDYYISLISTSESFVVSAVSRLVSSASAVSRLVRHVTPVSTA